MSKAELPLHWTYAVSCAVLDMRRTILDWNYADEERESGLYTEFPDVEKMIQICEGFINEPQSVSPNNIKTFQQMRETLINQLRPAYQAGRSAAQSYCRQPENDPQSDSLKWDIPDVYLTAYKYAPKGLSTIEARWFVDGFYTAWAETVGWRW